MSDETTTEETKEREMVTVEVDALKEIIREESTRAATEALAAAGSGTVDRSRVAVTLDGEKVERSDGKPELALPYGGGARLASPTAPLYRGLEAWEREFRNEDTDHWCAEWLRGSIKNDGARQLRAHDEIGKLFGRDLNTTSDASLIPAPMAASVLEIRRKMQKFGSLPGISRFVSESGTLKVPKELTFASVQKLAEAAAAAPDDPTYGDVTLTKKNSKVFTRASNEMLEDTPFNLVQMMSRGAGRSIALENDLQDVKTGVGTGENQTDAILNNGSVAATTFAVAGTITYLEVNKLYRAIASEWRSDAVFIGNNAVAGFLDDILDGNGRPMFGDDANLSPNGLEGGQGGSPDGVIKRRRFLEIPISTNELIIASPSAFLVLESGGIRAEVSRDVNFLNDQVVWKWVQRRDGAVGQAAGFAKTPVITAAA